MRIVFIAHRYWPSVGGVEKYLHELALALSQLGHEPTVIAAAHAENLPPADRHENIPILRFPATRSPLRCRWWFRRHRTLLRDADVISISNTHVWEYIWPWLELWVDPRRIFLIRHGMAMKFPVPEMHRARAARVQSNAAGVAHDGQFISRWLGVTADICPDQGLRPLADELPLVPTPKPNSALYIGRLEPDTGVAMYLDAIAALDPQRTGRFRLDLCGDGSLRPQLEARAQEERLSVRFLGRVANAQDLLGQYAFAFVDGRMAIQETMARRRPVISAFDTPLKRDYLCGESFSQHLFAAPTGVDLVRRVSELADNPAVRDEIVERAFEYARTLTWKATARRFLGLWTGASRSPAPSETTGRGAFAASASGLC